MFSTIFIWLLFVEKIFWGWERFFFSRMLSSSRCFTLNLFDLDFLSISILFHLNTELFSLADILWLTFHPGELVTTFNKHKRPIISSKWNKKGDYLLSGSIDTTAIVWNVKSGELKQQFDFHSGVLAPLFYLDFSFYIITSYLARMMC